MQKRTILAVLALTVFLGCQSIKPTVLLYGQLRSLNTNNVAMIIACSDGPNFTPEKETCDKDKLVASLEKTLEVSELAIRKDIRQAMPYVINLETSISYLRISRDTEGKFYTKAEQISRQFFEVQKTNSQRSLLEASFYFTYFTSAHAAFQVLHSPLELSLERKQELLFALQIGRTILHSVSPEKGIRLADALVVLENAAR